MHRIINQLLRLEMIGNKNPGINNEKMAQFID
jgi:hypothetical protein